jgi:hypothetical protein
MRAASVRVLAHQGGVGLWGRGRSSAGSKRFFRVAMRTRDPGIGQQRAPAGPRGVAASHGFGPGVPIVRKDPAASLVLLVLRGVHPLEAEKHG